MLILNIIYWAALALVILLALLILAAFIRSGRVVALNLRSLDVFGSISESADRPSPVEVELSDPEPVGTADPGQVLPLSTRLVDHDS